MASPAAAAKTEQQNWRALGDAVQRVPAVLSACFQEDFRTHDYLTEFPGMPLIWIWLLPKIAIEPSFFLGALSF